MGGLLCWARRSAILLYDSVPTDPKEYPKFDAQMRALIAAPDMAESLVSDTPGAMKELCAVLGKRAWTQEDRQFLLDTIESLYE